MDREKLENFAKIWVIGLVVFWIATMIAGFKYRPDVEKAEKYDLVKEYVEYWQGDGTRQIRYIIDELKQVEKSTNDKTLKLFIESDRIWLETILEEAPLPY